MPTVSEIQVLFDKNELNKIKKIIQDFHTPEILDLFLEIDERYRISLFKLIPKKLLIEVFKKLDNKLQEKILLKLSKNELQFLLFNLEPDDRTKLFSEISSHELIRKLINLLPSEERKITLKLLGYPKNSVGRLMTPDYIAIKKEWTIANAIKHIRKFGKDAETINMIYVVDNKWHLIDDIPIRKILLADPKQSVESIMDNKFISIEAHVDQEEAIKLFKKYNLISLPVTDNQGHLLGIVTVDDILETLEKEQTEDFTKFSAIDSEGVGLQFITRIKEIPINEIFRARITWLIALLLMDLITGGIIQGFEKLISKYVVLVTFLPVLVDTAGNVGSQSATLVIRAMAVGTIKMKDWLYLLGKEFLISSLLGLAMGFGISFMGFIRGKSITIASVVIIAMIINVIVGGIIGVILPFIFTRFKKDPATASTPLITTLADIIGTAIFLGIAFLILN